jgi:hypothetical protein
MRSGRTTTFVVILGALCAATFLACGLRHQETLAFDTPRHDTSFTWAVSHYLDDQATPISYRFEMSPTAEGAYYRADYHLGERIWTGSGRMTAAEYDAFMYGLEDCGLWEVESSGHYTPTAPTYLLAVCSGSRHHAAVFTNLSTAYQNSLHAFVMRTLPGAQMRALQRLADEEKPHIASALGMELTAARPRRLFR